MGNLCDVAENQGSDWSAQQQAKSHQAHLGSRWPNGKIFYLILIDAQQHPEIFEAVNTAILKWNQWNGPHCLFVMADEHTPSCINFLVDDSKAFKT